MIRISYYILNSPQDLRFELDIHKQIILWFPLVDPWVWVWLEWAMGTSITCWVLKNQEIPLWFESFDYFDCVFWFSACICMNYGLPNLSYVHIYKRDSVTTADFEVLPPISCNHSRTISWVRHPDSRHCHPDHPSFVTSPFFTFEHQYHNW